jgi:serine/threonine protein kinase
MNYGGDAFASGGFGCVFYPELKCENKDNNKSNNKDNISKLMDSDNATSEYKMIYFIKQKLKKIKHYNDYFLIDNISICNPSKLTQKDLKNYNKCSSLIKHNITKSNINKSLNKLKILNIPYGGVTLDTYIYKIYSQTQTEKLNIFNNSLINLLMNGIIKMNKCNIYHCDLKDSNLLINEKTNKIKIIDWGLSVYYIPFTIPDKFKNRPFQFNIPFSVIMFSDDFMNSYQNLKNKSYIHINNFINEYLHTLIKKREGHIKFITEIIHIIYDDNTIDIYHFISEHLTYILVNYNNKLENFNFYSYLDNVFIKIIDVWGFLFSYYPLLELLHENKRILNNNEIALFTNLKQLYIEFLYIPKIKAIDTKNLIKELSNLLNIV